MKLHFEPDLDFQQQAIASVVDLFKGQEHCQSEFTVLVPRGHDQPELDLGSSLPGYGNRLQLLEEDIQENLQTVQIRNGLRPDDALRGMDFTVEMETGTGKTYVYLRTIHELHKAYGFTKFVIVVPSVAIREGVFKSLRIMEDHFKGLYAGTPVNYFVYDSSDLSKVRSFASSSSLQIMVMTIQAIRSQKVAVMYQEHEGAGGERPIDLVRKTTPVVIVDEPQSVDRDADGAGRQALQDLNALCTLRYSATHIHKHQQVFRLDAVDAYQRKLVKQIEVASMEASDAHNEAYVKVVNVKNTRGRYTAILEVDRQGSTGIIRKVETVELGEDLAQLTGRDIYRGYLVSNMGVAKGNEFVEFQNLEHPLRKGDSTGDVDRDIVLRHMIQRTIVEHLDKEQRLRPMGIKVLSLFFIDEVANYRSYDKQGQPVKGKYALWFEEEYKTIAARAKYRTLFQEVDLSTEASRVHDGYFSIDKTVHTPFEDKELKRSATKEQVETDTYNLIMRDKERLLSLDTPLKFIFSHSALKEGWDNPNVFQICSLREMGSELQRRQSIGRGLRLCVNSNTGERVRGFDVNTLTVVANESFEQFAQALQTEIESETGLKFGVVEKDQFAGVGSAAADGVRKLLGATDSERIWQHLKAKGYIDNKGKVQDALRTALREDSLVLPEGVEEQAEDIKNILKKLAGKLDIRNADNKRPIKTREAVLHSEEFKALWDRIKHKTTYRVHFDEEVMIRACVEAIQAMPRISVPRMTVKKADVTVDVSGVDTIETLASAPQVLYGLRVPLPDVLSVLQDRTHLTRKSLVQILTECDRLPEFQINPQQFIDRASEAINRAKRSALVDGIKYIKLGELEFYVQERFETEELMGYLENSIECQRSVHERVIYDSAGIERSFAEELDRNEAVKLFAKLPGWFRVPTPLGDYNPDWAVVIDVDGTDRLYFVAETKSSLWGGDLRDAEDDKIKCGREHFKALAEGVVNPARYEVVSNVDELMERL
jgi:type III restriction enzyme